MKKSLAILVAFVLVLCFNFPLSSKAAIADGTYSIDYQVNKPGSNSASMANDYFLKPAKLIVENGKLTMQITIKNSAWVTEFNPPGGATVISDNPGADQRVVQFSVSDVNITTIDMKIDIDDIDYHHAYGVDFVFNGSGLPEAKEEPAAEPTQPSEPAEQQTPVKEEQPAEQATPAQPAQPSQSPGSTTSENKPASNNGGTTPSTQSSQPATATQQPTSSAKTEEAEQSESTKDDQPTETEEVATASAPETVENPETSDSLPLFYVAAIILAVGVLIGTRKTKTN